MNALTNAALASLLTASACGAVEPLPATPAPAPAPVTAAGVVTGDVLPAPAPLPATCADIAAADPTAADGEYMLYVGGDARQAWLAYCADLATTPVEYLPLVAVLGDHNFSQYTAGGASPGTSVRTSYLRLRIDPATLAVDIGDQRFAVSTGGLTHSGSTPVSSMPFGVAMSCDARADGLANIDLRGTGFVLATTFARFGAGAGGGATIDPTGEVASLTGGGNCGWTAAQGVPFNPFNATHGWVIHLAFHS